MAEAYIGEIRMFAGIDVPRDWHWCDGSLLKISEYAALFSLIGAIYGGDGQTNFALPDLRGRLLIGSGKGYELGETGGTENVVLTKDYMPSHDHTIAAASTAGVTNIPGNYALWANGGTLKPYSTVTSPVDTDMSALAISYEGSNKEVQAHTNLMPSFPLNFMICLNGIYPMFTEDTEAK